MAEDENGEEVCDHPACELIVRSVMANDSFTVMVDCAMCGERIQLTGKPYVVKM